ncbi:MAG: hypothetical protein U9O53_04470 [archaeon]|nr:hypothetical protein [archaeon]
MKAVKHGEYDYTFFVNSSELEKLKGFSLEGELWNREFPYDCLGTKLLLRLATDDDICHFATAGSDFERREFWIREVIYHRVQENGRCVEVRYDGGGNKIDIINYEEEGKRDDPWYGGLMEDLELI